MRDLISRQAAIDAIVAWTVEDRPNVEMPTDLIGRIRNIPSAQPEQPIRCKDCIHWDTTWQNDFAPDYHYCAMVDGTRRSDYYCADAERRNDG